MPVNVVFTKDETGVILYHEGTVTGEELINAVTRVFADERFPQLKYWIGDRTNCSNFTPDSDCIKRIVELSKKESIRNPGMLLALVAPKDVEFGMSRMFQTYAEGTLFHTEVFRDRAAADYWLQQSLGIDLTDSQPHHDSHGIHSDDPLPNPNLA